MGQALYRKYRSKKLSEIVGQEHITKTLAQAVKTNRISHAYLFTGPRGVGKTSIARILAHDINQLPYKDDTPHVDIIEIDAASNRRIDEIRELREMVYIAPVSATYKVYIIDEVHMLTKEAFNALLKTLEEPPKHIVFILATTDAQKLPDTIISRTQRFQFKPIVTKQIVDHLKQIAKAESITVEDPALQIIAEHGQGSFRDSIGLLDQAANYAQPITVEAVQSLLGIPPSQTLERLIDYLSQAEPQPVIQSLQALAEQGYDPATVASQLATILRQQLIDNTHTIDPQKILLLLEQLINVPASLEPQHYLEICLLKALSPTSNKPPVVKQQPTPQPKIVLPTNNKNVTSKDEPVQTTTPKPKPSADKPTVTTPDQVPHQLDDQTWTDVINLLKTQYNTLYGIIRMARVDFSKPQTLTLEFAFAFHQKRLKDAKNQAIIKKALLDITHQDYHIECLVNSDLLNQPKPKDELANIANVFGGAEPL